MTRYLDVAAVSDLIKSIGPEPFIVELADYIRDDYLRWEKFEKSARPASHSPTGVIELMPATDGKLYAFKYVNGHPKNTARHMLTVMAFGVLAEVETGYPLLLSEFTIMTAMRTAATSALAAKHMARKNSRSMALIGNGAQSEFQALAFKAVLGISEIRAFDIDREATDKLIRNLESVKGLKITPAKSIEEAVFGADIVTTATASKTRAAILTPGMIKPGTHINGIGGDCPGKTELHPDILKTARIAVEFEPQTRIEGDIQQLGKDSKIVELWRILSGQEPGRQSEEQVTVFDSVGFAIEDFSSLRYLHDIAEARNAGQKLALIPTLENPKDLYGLIGGEEVLHRAPNCSPEGFAHAR